MGLKFYGQPTDSSKKTPSVLPKLTFDLSYGVANLQQLSLAQKIDFSNYNVKWFGPALQKLI